MEESVEDPYHLLATLTDPFSLCPTSDLFLPETPCPLLSEGAEGGPTGAIPIVGPDDNFEIWDSGVQAVPSGAPFVHPLMDEAMDTNSSYPELDESSRYNFAVSGDSQQQFDLFEPIRDDDFFAECLDTDPMVLDSMLPEDGNLDFLSAGFSTGDTGPEVMETAVSPLAGPKPAQVADGIDCEETDIRPSLPRSSGCGPPLKGVSILRAWFDSHDYPYPKPHELQELVQASGLSQKQVRTFFTNMRARSWKSNDLFHCRQLSAHAPNELKRSATEPGLESLTLANFRAPSASSVFIMQWPVDDNYPEAVIGGAETQSSSQDSSYRVEAGSEQKLSPMPSSETLTSGVDSNIVDDGMPLTRRRLLTLTQKLKEDIPVLPTVESLSIQRFLSEPEYAVDTENIIRAIDETTLCKLPKVCYACNRCRSVKSKCDGANPCTRCRLVNATCETVPRSPKKQPKLPPKLPPKFILGDSSGGSSRVSSIGVRSILSSASARSDCESRQGKMAKVTSFNNEVNIRWYSSSDTDDDTSEEPVVADEDGDDEWGSESQPSALSINQYGFQWTPEEDNLALELRGQGMKWSGIAKRLNGKSFLACKLRYQRYLNERAVWDEEKKSRLIDSQHALEQESSSPPAKRQRSGTSLTSGYGSRVSVASASSYALSAVSGASSNPGRKGKRRWSQTLQRRDHDEEKATRRADNSKTITYDCTFCWKPCKDRWDWSRHEDTHVEPVSWTCMPEGFPTILGICLFCSRTRQASHGETLDQVTESLDQCGCRNSQHVTNCLKRQLSERTYSTKDGLKGHIRRMHNTEFAQDNSLQKIRASLLLAHWSRPKSPVELRSDALWCGFCEESFRTWENRVNHVAAHFRELRRPNVRQLWKFSPTLHNKQRFDDNEAAREVPDNVEDETLRSKQKRRDHNRDAYVMFREQEHRIKELEAELAALKSSTMPPASFDDDSTNLASPHISDGLYNQVMLPSVGYF